MQFANHQVPSMQAVQPSRPPQSLFGKSVAHEHKVHMHHTGVVMRLAVRSGLAKHAQCAVSCLQAAVQSL